MRGQGRSEGEVDSMLALLEAFEAKCLAASQPATPEECKQVRAEGWVYTGASGCRRGSSRHPCCPHSFLTADSPAHILLTPSPSLPQLCLHLERRLREVYGPQLVLAAHDMSAAALESGQGGAGVLLAWQAHPLRLLTLRLLRPPAT